MAHKASAANRLATKLTHFVSETTSNFSAASMADKNIRSRKAPINDVASEEGRLGLEDDLDESQETDGLLFSDTTVKKTPSRRSLEEDAAVQFPSWAYAIIVTLTAYTLIYAYVKGTYVTPCSGQLWFWLFYLTPMPLCRSPFFAGIANERTTHIESLNDPVQSHRPWCDVHNLQHSYYQPKEPKASWVPLSRHRSRVGLGKSCRIPRSRCRRRPSRRDAWNRRWDGTRPALYDLQHGTSRGNRDLRIFHLVHFDLVCVAIFLRRTYRLSVLLLLLLFWLYLRHYRPERRGHAAQPDQAAEVCGGLAMILPLYSRAELTFDLLQYPRVAAWIYCSLCCLCNDHYGLDQDCRTGSSRKEYPRV